MNPALSALLANVAIPPPVLNCEQLFQRNRQAVVIVSAHNNPSIHRLFSESACFQSLDSLNRPAKNDGLFSIFD